MSRILIGIGLAAGLAVGLWLLLDRGAGSSGEGDIGAAAPGATAPEEQAEPPGPEELARPGTPEEPPERSVASPVLHEGEPKPEATPQPADGILVRIIEAESGECVPGAEVRHLDPDSIDEVEMEKAFAEGMQLAEWLERFGALYLADTGGELRLPRLEEGGSVSARHGELFALRPLQPDECEPLIIELRPQVHVRVQVVDSGGAPRAGIPVALRVRDEYWTHDSVVAETAGPDGIAVIRNVDLILKDLADTPVDTFLGIAALLPEPVEVAIDRDDIPAEVVVLRLPPTGEVEVRVLDTAGDPMADGDAWVILAPAQALEYASIDEIRFLRGRPQAIQRGAALFPFVGLGMRLQASGWRESGDTPTEVVGPGPNAPDERVELTLCFDANDPILLGRLLYHNGEPCAGQGISYTLHHYAEGGARSSGGRFRTDEAGRFEVVLVEDTDPDWDVREIEFRHEKEATRQRTAVIASISHCLGPEPHELGDLVLTPLPLLASGVVVDGDGQSLEDAEVLVEVPLFAELQASRVAAGLSVPDQVPDVGESTRWIDRWEWRTRSTASGAFEIRGHTEATMLRLRASKARHYGGSPVEVGRGAVSVRLVLSGGGRVVGSLLLDENLPKNAVRASIEGPESTSPAIAILGEDGGFAWSSRPPGFYAVGIVPVADSEPILRVEGVRVEAGETTEDPRMQPIDLRGRITFARLEAVDEQGGGIGNATFVVGGTEAHRTKSFRPWRGMVELATARPSLDVEVFAPGFRPQELVGIRGDRKVVLEKGIPVRLVLADLPTLPPGCHLRAFLDPEEGGMLQRTDTCRFDETGEARPCVSEPGVYRVVLMAHRVERNSGTSVTLYRPEPEIEVVEGGEQTFQLEIRPKWIEMALGRL